MREMGWDVRSDILTLEDACLELNELMQAHGTPAGLRDPDSGTVKSPLRTPHPAL